MPLFDQDFTMVSGDSRRLLFRTYTDDTLQTRKDLTGSGSVRWEMHSAPPQDAGSAPLVQKSLTSGISITDPVNGEFLVIIDPADTEAIAAGFYYHEAEVIDSAGDVVTVAIGDVTMYADAIT